MRPVAEILWAHVAIAAVDTVVEVFADNWIRVGRWKVDISSSKQPCPTHSQLDVTFDTTQCLVDLSTFATVQGQGDPLTYSVQGGCVPLSVRDVDVAQLQALFPVAGIVPRPQTIIRHLQSRDATL